MANLDAIRLNTGGRELDRTDTPAVKGTAGYGYGEPERADNFVCEKSDFFKVGENLNRPESRSYLEATMASRGLKALDKAPPNVQKPMKENMEMYGKQGYDKTTLGCMCFAVLQKLGYA